MQNKAFIVNLIRGVSKMIKGVSGGKNKQTGLTWFKEKYIKHAKSGVLRSYNYKGKNIYYKHPAEFLHTLKEIFENEIYRVELPENPYVIDCGANIGLSVVYIKELYPAAEIISFEPDEQNFELLSKNVQSFGYDKVQLRKEAVWITDTDISFSNDGTMSSKIEEGQKSINTVKAIRLKSLLNRTVDFLKIDIEGAEYAVLKDIAPELVNVKNMFLEYHGNFTQARELTDIFNWVSNAGFHYYIKEAANIYTSPFMHKQVQQRPMYDVQLNIFCFR